MKAGATILALVILLACVLSGCAGTAASGTSRDLKRVLSSEDIDFEIYSFTAWKRGAGYLQIDVNILHDVADFQPGFELELQHAATLCAVFANSDITFDLEWWALKITSVIWYGSYWRWDTDTSWTQIFIERETLLELRERGAVVNECPQHWEVSASKEGEVLPKIRRMPPIP